MKQLSTINDLLELCGDKKSSEIPDKIKTIASKHREVLLLIPTAGDYSQFISESSIKNLDEKIRLLTALKDGKTFEDLGLEPGKPKFKLLFEDYPADGEVII